MLAWVASVVVAVSASEALSVRRHPGTSSYFETVDAPELESARDVPKPEVEVGVRLPSRPTDCADPHRTCWLLIYLGGFDASAKDSLATVGEALKDLEGTGGVPPIAAVVVDGRTSRGGGWYVDSLASGGWEKWLLTELIPAAQAALAHGASERTVIIGHSMGGFGALRLAELHPQAFAAVGALNPILRPAQLADLCLSRLPKATLSDGGPIPGRLAAPFGGGGFCARIVASLLSTFGPGRTTPEASVTVNAGGEWQLLPVARAALEEASLIRPESLSRIPRMVVTTGAHDPLSPPADLDALSEAAGSADNSSVITRVSSGDHNSHLTQDLADAVRYLTAEGAAGGGPR